MREGILLTSTSSVYRRPPANLIEGDEELFQDGYSYATKDSYLIPILNAWVTADSVIYKNGLPMRESLYWPEQVGYYRLSYLAKKVLLSRKVRLPENKRYLLVTDQESAGHFHWLTEVLPRLWSIRSSAKDFVLLLPDRAYVRTRGLESLEILGFSFAGIVLMNDAEFYNVPDLQYVTRIAKVGQLHDQIMQQLHNAFAGKKRGGARRLYISRQRARFRKVLNEDALVERLKNNAFEILHPEDWSLADQIETFSGCGTLASIHGAGLTNCLFMKPGGNVIELRKRERNFAYWHLAESVRHNYLYYHGEADSEGSLIGRGCNLTIDPDDFEKKILNRLGKVNSN